MLDKSIYPKIDINTYHKEVELKDGTKVLLRPMVAEDQDALYEFFKGVHREVALYLRHDVSSRQVIEGWAKNLDYEIERSNGLITEIKMTIQQRTEEIENAEVGIVEQKKESDLNEKKLVEEYAQKESQQKKLEEQNLKYQEMKEKGFSFHGARRLA